MKYKYILLLTSLALTVFSACKEKSQEMTVDQMIASKDLKALNTEREILREQESQLRKDIQRLDAEIAKLDPTAKEYDIVTTITPIDTAFYHYVEVQGSVKTKEDVMIYPEYSGVMTQLNVREGQYIKRGSLIATIDDGGMRQQIAQQQVQLALAKTTYERQKSLWEQNIGSEIQYLQAKNNYEALQKGIAAMEEQLKKINVYAPFSGSVEEVITKQGQVVAPGATPIIRLVGLGSMYVEADVPENYLPTIRKGTKAIVNLNAINTEYNTRVKRINSTINEASRSFVIEVGVPKNSLVKPNLIANLKINDYSNENATLIPRETINENAMGEEFVFVVDTLLENNIAKVKQVVVETGESTNDGWVEILNGLDGTKKVIAEGAKTLADGDEVQLLSDQPKGTLN